MINVSQELRDKHSPIAREILRVSVNPYAQDYVDRFLERTEIHENSCWIWKYGLDSDGYAKIWVPECMVSVHRWSYILFKGAIPEGLELDHLCKNRKCVNPDHLEAVTHQENARRAKHVFKTHCIRGHALNEENTYVYSNGSRKCKACRAQLAQNYYYKQKLARSSAN